MGLSPPYRYIPNGSYLNEVGTRRKSIIERAISAVLSGIFDPVFSAIIIETHEEDPSHLRVGMNAVL
jgi:hypothetical protein